MNRFTWFKILRMADGEGGGGSSASASTSTMGDAAAASSDGSSASATIPSGIGGKSGDAAAAAAASGDFKTRLGEFGKDPMFADFKDEASLAKSYQETKKLVGQKLGIPAADSTPEAKAAFYKALGVPDTAEAYGFKKPADLPDSIPYDEKDAAEWAAYMKENNVPAPVANALRDRFIKQQVDAVKKMTEGQTEDATRTDANFDQLATKAFGDKKELALQNSRAMMEKYLSPEAKATFANAPNSHLVAFAEFASNYSKEMTGEDQVLSGGTGGDVQSEGEMRQEMRTIMAKPQFSNPFAEGGKEAHVLARSQVDELSKKIARAQEVQRKKR